MSVRLSLCVLMVVCAAGCGSSATPIMSPAPTPDPAPAGSVTVTIPAGAASQTTGAFVPNALTVSVGATVSFLNSDTIAHTSTADGGAWSSPNLLGGQRFNVTLQAPGRFPYHCQIHPGMIGTITVQ